MESTPLIPFEQGRFVDPLGRKMLIAILACEKYQGRVDSVRGSWLPMVPDTFEILFVYGRPGQPSAREGDRLFLDCPESYEMLPRKVHELLAYAVGNLDFDYLFKTDDDTYLDLERFIGCDLQDADYVGQFREMPVPVPEIGKTYHYGKCTDRSFEVPYERPFICPWATGGGYFLSRRAAEIAAQRTARSHPEHLFEDVMVGEALTRDPDLKVIPYLFSDMGVVNPLLPKDMRYLQDVLAERRRLTEEVQSLRRENLRLQRQVVATPASSP
jgi:hypothetical protein